ncbi:cyclic nucleotide-binding domain containing protein [Neospora caninum Liverpool]|uniref:Cyclic nucleotide-binding domain containing protein n=1 Tax=Neospora caninum (strain Liverpool) TaxID=572307 RepID=F0VEZ7_NEOCL|nr:cyclic nucleotide-binding domain containing protein [Neospora caninum Liverpool]CBZ52291.1 cyclic nucleotide-binding domain containing protein [Neospora caninum Liverpool]|eukprot:XP_003882323.1 cyclic nucleotide-binding domain containing protein [Neospora caninum Liverpool]
MKGSLTFLQLEALREAASKVDDIDGMFQVISNVNLFSKLDEATQKSLCRSLTYEVYAPKQVVFRYGDWGDKYYIVLTGRVSVQAPVTPTSETFQQVAILESGGGFGEMALMENKPRAATVVCLETTGTLVLTREAYQTMAMRKHKEMFEKHVHFLQSLTFLRGCADTDIKALAEKLKEHSYPGPHIILRQGEEASQVILVESGTVLALRSMKVDANLNLVPKKREKRSSRLSLLNAAGKAGANGNGPQEAGTEGMPLPFKVELYESSKRPQASPAGISIDQQDATAGKHVLVEDDVVAKSAETSPSAETGKMGGDGKPKKRSGNKTLVLQVANLNRRSIYGAREILDGEKNAIVAERGNVYGVTLVAFPAAQSLTDEMKRSIDLASGPLPEDSELLHQYLQAVKWDAYKRQLADEVRLRFK